MPDHSRIELLDLDQAGMEALASALNQPAYRGRQLYQWIYARRCDDLSQMSDLPKGFREALQNNCTLSIPKAKKIQISRDGTRKYLLELTDGICIEMVAIPHLRGQRSSYTLCVSTQAGCPLACAFCATGAAGFVRNLHASEISGQVLRALIDLPPEGTKNTERSISNVVFMGMGEPLLNYAESLKAVRVINDEGGINIGQRHITISTAGVVPGIEKLADEGLQITLAVSLHAADNATRDRLVPLNRKYPLERLIKAVEYFSERTGRRVSFEYTLLHAVNTSREDARRLAALVKPLQANINLIPFNAAGHESFSPPERDEIRKFMSWLEQSGVGVTLRKEHGADIDAACGQLSLRSTN